MIDKGPPLGEARPNCGKMPLALMFKSLGAVFTVSVAEAVVVVPLELVKTAWYLSPFCAEVAEKVRMAEVAPGMLLKVSSTGVQTCHCTVGAGLPTAAATKETLLPAFKT